ncbi:MAG: GNAT family protein [Acidobacteriota bacterium]
MAKLFTSNPAAGAPSSLATVPLTGPTDWRASLPTLSNGSVILREPVAGDALALLTALTPEALAQAVPAGPPASQAGFEAMIAATAVRRAQGAEACWAIVPRDSGVPVGLIRVRALDHGFTMVEGTAAIAEEFRGTHVFQEAARLALDCVFRTMQVHRAEFRIEVRNARANGALRKLGATQEGLLRRALHRDGVYLDQVLWSIVASDWCAPQDTVHPRIH